MSQENSNIDCPKCGEKINVNDILYSQLETEVKSKYDGELAKAKEKIDTAALEIEKEKKDLKDQRLKVDDAISEGIEKELKKEKKSLEKGLRKQIEDESSEQLSSMQDELNLKSTQLKDLNKTKAEIEKLKREKEEVVSDVEAKLQKEFSAKLKQERTKFYKQEDEKVKLKLSEKELVIEQLKDQLKDAHRKAEQGSTQLQGEVQELAIENWLKDQFPLDKVEEVKKGAFGADCIQYVNTRANSNCGSIYYESKRTKSFQPAWIEKFKTDIREKGANVGVLITESMPSDMPRMGLKDGIWICTLEEFRGLCFVLRENIIEIKNAIATQENKGDKMTMLYDFLTSAEFKNHIEAIVEGFTQMQTDLESEKRSMQGIWKKREKQIQKVLLNTSHMYSSIKGIAGNAIQSVSQLELPDGDSGD